jgi:uncharacterized repeat protein (TIGR01451 family)
MKRKNLFTAHWMEIMFILGAMVFVTEQSLAAGVTRALTSIVNTATVNYKNQSNAGDYSASDQTTLHVAYQVVINAPNDAGEQPAITATVVSVPLSITNSGNYTDQYDVKFVGMFKDLNKNGTMDGAETIMGSPWKISYDGTPIQDGTTTVPTPVMPEITFGGSAYVKNVIVEIPEINDYDDDYVVLLEIKSKTIEGTGGLHIITPGFSQTWKLPILIRKPHIVLAVTPPAGTNKVPGTNVTYTVNVANDGPIDLPTGTLTFTHNAAYTGSPTTESFTFDLAHGTNVNKTVTVTIDRTLNHLTGPKNGQSVDIPTTDISFSHTFFNYPITAHPSTVTSFLVDRAQGVSISEFSPKVFDGEQGVASVYYFKVKNEGNADAGTSLTDFFTFVKGDVAHTSGYLPTDMAETYTYYLSTADAADPASVGTWSASIGSGATFTQSTAGLSGGESRWVKVEVMIPLTAQNLESRTFSFQLNNADQTGNPVLNNSTYFTSGLIAGYQVTVKAPNLDIKLIQASISGTSHDVNNPYPGDIITFLITVTNQGTKNANHIVVSQAVPTQMTFQPSFSGVTGKGITVEGVEVTNTNTDADGAYFDGTSVKTDEFSMTPSQVIHIQFKAMVN